MFPTTLWSTIRQAGKHDPGALQRFAERYRPVLHDFVRRRGFGESDAEDVCQDVFVRVLSGAVLTGADPAKGRFRSLLLTITTRVMADLARRMQRRRTESLEREPADRDPDFDQSWALHLARTALDRLREEGSPYYEVLVDHLSGKPQDRKRLWNARRKLIALIRHEVALTCSSHREFEEEVAYLSGFLRPGLQKPKKE
ncbi:MAG: RNA polymerase sigma factor [Planctomycetota bacterium]|nr:RNA polymerase sigma factor [Planctomycetota bacterium]